ncbi:hypothetical protein O181_091198 [Austropuccinia psidii MF-1]|uniref:Uncharacterized protein n=1 Tax=Austropuccinia psidii MF-1 TaxID=1389203 RepID=A0A9Q3IWC9_9BASI|nr:hypothetical protein [Austropuccinia psidii MF-1]
MALGQSMLEQLEVRQQRNQVHKAHNVAKHSSQKKQTKCLKVELLENVHGMRSAVHAHCLFLLKVRDKNFSSLPEPPRTEEHEIAIQLSVHLGYVPKDVFNDPSTQVQSQGLQRYCKKFISHDGELITHYQALITHDQKFIPHDEEVFSNDEKLIPNDEERISNDEKLIPHDGELISHHEELIPHDG